MTDHGAINQSRNLRLDALQLSALLDEFNEFAFADRVDSVESMIRDRLLYLFDRSVAQAGYYVVQAAMTEKDSVNFTPPTRKDEFWN